MKSRAAVAFEAGKPLEIVDVDLEGPREGEVLGLVGLRGAGQESIGRALFGAGLA